jgi:hypothetical protein
MTHPEAIHPRITVVSIGAAWSAVLLTWGDGKSAGAADNQKLADRVAMRDSTRWPDAGSMTSNSPTPPTLYNPNWSPR